MYLLLFALTALAGGLLIFIGVRRERRTATAAGVGVFALLFLFIWFMGFWSEKLWFDSLGFADRFWTEFYARLATGGGFLAAGVLFSYLFSLSIPRLHRYARRTLVGVSALISGLAGLGQWQTALRFVHRSSAGVADPILGLDAGFYLFSLPFLEAIYGLFLTLSVIALLAGIISAHPRGRLLLSGRPGAAADDGQPDEEREISSRGLVAGSVLLLLVLSAGKLLDRYRLLYASGGVVSGPGWTDDHVVLPALTAAAIVGLIGAVLLLVPAVRKGPTKIISRLLPAGMPGRYAPFVSISVVVFLTWGLFTAIVPWLFQSLVVAPNEITSERPYIEHNIRFTRDAFKLDTIREEEFPVTGEFNRSTVEENRGIIDNTRLWDWRALSSVYQQFQEIRLYYEFGDIDVDRYPIDGRSRAVMVAAREMETGNLPAQSQNFVNRRFKYTHGYGIAMNTVNEFTESGLPHLLIRDIPPVSERESLAVERPEIYYGERTDSYVIVNSEEEEFDYPEGDTNKYVRYQGSGGVEISNFFRKFMFGYRFGGTKLLFSSYPDRGSRIMFRRRIEERISEAAPFLQFDRDPYIVLIGGELRWIVDAYTTSSSYPYSEHFDGGTIQSGTALETSDRSTEALGRGINYARNSVKAVVDPYNGNIDFYIYDESDPIIRVWKGIYPDLFRSKAEMPEELRRHVRYPADFLLIQGEVYAKYHMTDPEVFYNQEDLWVRATEKYYNAVQPVEPYYIMWERPGSDEPEFIIMLPYTPKNKQVLIGWIAGVSDPEHYGEFIAYKFPKEQRVLGPQQVETKIDQDSFLSGQLSLWDQRGSNVIRGNVLVLPLDGTLLYVEPIYLQSETAAYPELRMVVLMHNDTLSYAETLEGALEGLFSGTPPAAETAKTGDESGGGPSAGPQQSALIERAAAAIAEYRDATGAGEYSRAGSALEELSGIIEQLSAGSGE